MDLKQFGKRVAELRSLKGWTQEDFARAMGVSRSQVQNWEGGRKGTTTQRLMKLYEVFGVTPEQFWDNDYIPDGLFATNRGQPGDGSVTGNVVPDVDERGRALACPRCKYNGYSDRAIYCPMCAYPLYNLCSGTDRHRNVSSARFCETCGARTFWWMDADELQRHGVPPLP